MWKPQPLCHFSSRRKSHKPVPMWKTPMTRFTSICVSLLCFYTTVLPRSSERHSWYSHSHFSSPQLRKVRMKDHDCKPVCFIAEWGFEAPCLAYSTTLKAPYYIRFIQRRGGEKNCCQLLFFQVFKRPLLHVG